MKSGNDVIATTTLGKRDRQILDDVIRYRLITNEWVMAQYLAAAKPNATVKITGRLVREGWLTSHSLFQRRRYFTAGTRLARQRGLPMARTRPLGTQALATYFATMRYCCPGSSVASPRLATRDELRQRLPWLPETFLARQHILGLGDTTTDWRLLRIDFGARPDHLARKVAADVRRLQEIEPFETILRGRSFQMVILCPTRNKKRTLEVALADRPWPAGLRFQIGVIPELCHLLSLC